MSLPIQLVSTDFDGTTFSELENPRVPLGLQGLLGGLQARGVGWVINTGRDLGSLTESLRSLELSVAPDYVVTVEREIYRRVDGEFVGLDDWNRRCAHAHRRLFSEVREQLPEIVDWIKARFEATIFEDPYSPFCLIAENPEDADLIHDYLVDFTRRVPDLTVVRNDVYSRFSHRAFNKGSALAEISRRIGVTREAVFAAGDHLNDLPMLSRRHAHWLAAPSNAIEVVKQTVRRQNGYVSQQPYGNGVARGLEYFLESTDTLKTLLNGRRS